MTINNTWLKTKRLVIYHPNTEHFDLYKKLLKNSEVTKYVFDYIDEAVIKQDFDKVISHHAKHGYSVGPIFTNNTLEFIGRAGFINKIYNNQEYLCLSYLLQPDFWNKGYGTEIVEEIINAGFNELIQDKILVYINVLNIPSQNLLKKFHPTLVGTCEESNKKFYIYFLEKDKVKLEY